MNTAILKFLVITFVLLAIACGNQPAGSSEDSPTGAYKRLYAAVKSKNTEAIRKELSKKSIDFGVMFSQRSGKTIEQAYENGFTATTFSPNAARVPG